MRPGIPCLSVLFGVALLGAGCASVSTPKPDTSQAKEVPPPSVQPEVEPPAATEEVEPPAATEEVEPRAEATSAEKVEERVPPDEPSGPYGFMTIVIDDPPNNRVNRQTLADAARKTREARPGEGETIAVITDETLPDYATGELSIVTESETAWQPDDGSGTAFDGEGEEEMGEDYWRTRVKDARIRWRDLLEETEYLEGRVGELRQRFYAEDDGFYRDSQIKPAWDRALDRLAEIESGVVEAQADLAVIIQEGRLSGALPGWLREGIEFEPPPDDPERGLSIHEVMEPEIIEIKDTEGDGAP